MIRKHSYIKTNATGFTIVELLIVIVVIAILAAITIVAYSGISSRAQASSAKASAAQASQKIAAWLVDNTNVASDLATMGLNSTSSTDYQYSYTPNTSTYCITVTVGSASFYISNINTTPTAGACAGQGSGGVAAIKNLMTNPGAENGLISPVQGGNATITAASDWAADGSNSFKITPLNATSGDSYFNIGGDQGGFRGGLQAGKTYTISGTIHLSAPLTGTLGNNGPLAITAWYTNAAGNIVKKNSTAAANVAGTTRLSVTFTIASDALGAWLRFYSGAPTGGGIVWYDDIMITEGSTLYNYADPDTAPSSWVWDSTVRNSTSTGVPQ